MNNVMCFLMLVLLASSITSCDRPIPIKLFPIATKICGEGKVQTLAGDMNEFTITCSSGQVFVIDDKSIDLSQ